MSPIDTYAAVYGKPSPTTIVEALIADDIKDVPSSWLIASIALTDRVEKVLDEANEKFEPIVEFAWDSRAETAHMVAKGTSVAQAAPAVVNHCAREITSANFGLEVRHKGNSLTVEADIVKAKGGGFDLRFLKTYCGDAQLGPTWHLPTLSTDNLRKAIFGLMQDPSIAAWSKPTVTFPTSNPNKLPMPWDNFPGGRLSWENMRSGGNI